MIEGRCGPSPRTYSDLRLASRLGGIERSVQMQSSRGLLGRGACSSTATVAAVAFMVLSAQGGEALPKLEEILAASEAIRGQVRAGVIKYRLKRVDATGEALERTIVRETKNARAGSSGAVVAGAVMWRHLLVVGSARIGNGAESRQRRETIGMDSEEKVRYLANVLHICGRERSGRSLIEKALSEVCKGIGAFYSDRSKAQALLDSGSFEMQFTGRLSERIRNVEDMLFLAMVDGEIPADQQEVLTGVAREARLDMAILERIVDETAERCATLREGETA